LPSETPGVVVPYTCLDNMEDLGIGLHLYFVYIKFCIVITFIGLCLAAIPTMVFAKRYSNNLKDYCEDYIFPLNITKIDELDLKVIMICVNYLDFDEASQNNDIIKTTWLNKFNGNKIIDYYNLFGMLTDNYKPIEDVIINFSFVYFLTSIVLLIINFFFIHYVNLINDKEDFESTTPRDYTVLIQGVKRPDKNTTKLKHLQNIINEISDNYFKLKVHHIIPCYNLVKLYKLTKDVFEDKIKIYHAYNFKRQKDLHKIYSSQYHPDKECNYDRNNYKIYDPKVIINSNNISNNNYKYNC
jgi:hypothetical protein